eukprot:SM000147S01117  [mRNA]  locus=s147:247271:252110:+ [translate_table: standard]
MMVRDYGRRKPASAAARPRSDKELEAARRLDEVVERLQAALALGWTPPSQQPSVAKPLRRTRGEEVRWECADASVQLQAAKALGAYVQCLAAHFAALAKDPAQRQKQQAVLADCSAALEALLAPSASPQARSRAAQACDQLQGGVLALLAPSSASRLAPALVRLLGSSQDAEHRRIAVQVLERILSSSRPRARGARAGARDDAGAGIWPAVLLAQPVECIWRLLTIGTGKDGGKDAGYVPLQVQATGLRVLAVLAEQWPPAKLAVAQSPSWLPQLMKLCSTTALPELTQAAMAVLCIVASEGDFAKELLSAENSHILVTIARRASESSPTQTKEGAFNLLKALAASPTFGKAFGGSSSMGDIVKACLLGLQPAERGMVVAGGGGGPSPLATDVAVPESLELAALQAMLAVLRWPGSHHAAFVKYVGVKRLLGLCSRSGSDTKMQLLAWQALEWLVTLHGASVNPSATSRARKAGYWDAPELAEELRCLQAIIPVVCEEFWHIPESGHAPIVQAGIAKCRLILSLLSSPSPQLAQMALQGFQTALSASVESKERLGMLLSAMERLGRGRGLLAVDSASVQLLLLRMAVLARLLRAIVKVEGTTGKVNVTGCRAGLVELIQRRLDQDQYENLSGGEKLEYLEYSASGIEDASLALPQEFLYAGGVSLWEGQDGVLLASLELFFELSQHLKCVGAEATAGVTVDVAREVLLRLAEACMSRGVRCWALRALACLGTFGCSSPVGVSLERARDANHVAADVVFSFPDGRQLHAHRVVLEARCPAVLCSSDTADSSTTAREALPPPQGLSAANSTPTVISMSHRAPFATFQRLVLFAYSGQVCMTDEVEAEELRRLARKCKFAELVWLLDRQRPAWGHVPAVLDMTVILEAKHWECIHSSDAILVWPREQQDVGCNGHEHACGRTGPHLHVHKFVLAARSEYFRALLGSGMRESRQGAIEVPGVSGTAVVGFVRFVYSGRLSFNPLKQAGHVGKSISSGNSAKEGSSLDLPQLSAALQLAMLSEQWMMADLQRVCKSLVYRDLSHENAIQVLQEGYALQQWWAVEAAITCLAPLYATLRDNGLLDEFPPGASDALRSSHVRLWQE